jgi:hypothetical protein
MEGRIFQQLYRRVRELGKTHSFKGKQFGDATIVLVHLWAVLWDRRADLAGTGPRRPARGIPRRPVQVDRRQTIAGEWRQ